MTAFERARELMRTGHASAAIEALSVHRPEGRERLATEVLRAQLFEMTGQYQSAVAIVKKLRASSLLDMSQQSTCEFILARVAADRGTIQASIEHFHRAALLAKDAKDMGAEFQARVRLFELISQRSVSVEALAPPLADIRVLATRLGDVHCTAQLHVLVAAMEAKRGLFSNARRHLTIARRLTINNPHLSVSISIENIEFGIQTIQSEYEEAKKHACAAYELAEKSGRPLAVQTVLTNLGSWHYAIGELQDANRCLEGVVAKRTEAGLAPHVSAAFEALSKVRLSESRLEECVDLLNIIDSSSDIHRSYVYREAQLTRASLLLRNNHIDEALNRIETVTALAEQSDDHLHAKKAGLAKAEVLARCGSTYDALKVVESLIPKLVGDSPELFAQAEQTLACALIREGDVVAAHTHRSRASRLCATIGSITAGRTLDDQWAEACNAAPPPQPTIDSPAAAAQRATRAAVQAIASAVAHSSRPRIAADELEHVLAAAGCVERSSVESRPPADVAASPAACTADRFLRVGRHKEHAVGVSLCRKKDADSVATVASVEILAQAIEELVRARAEREERATLWPVDELPIEGDSSILTGHMRKQINFAQKIAQANVNVLITGQSGTGKEVVARAIHNFSDRAKKPFVPFNCTAVPRDLLESQLFGHRRGAFTGADRDHIGLIRSARGGTLFLDEIGELGLDLQPKLLRFLESGEMATLGDVQLQKADVRIIAATNANLEDAVQAGRFREDLFYRLNVVRLTILPLRERRDEIPNFVHHFAARAAEEFNKGRITIAEETMERLSLYRWPGNVRQLQNEVRRMVALAEPNSTLTPDAIDPDILGTLPIFDRARVHGAEISIPLKAKLNPTLARIECEMIKAALAEHGGRVDAVAKALGISRKGLYLKRQRFGL